jgi:hypothetical protein
MDMNRFKTRSQLIAETEREENRQLFIEMVKSIRWWHIPVAIITALGIYAFVVAFAIM